MTIDRREIAPFLPAAHSYEAFAQQPFYQEVDRALLEKAPRCHRLTDFATGTGAIIEQLIKLGKLQSPFVANAVDIDEDGLAIAEAKFAPTIERGVDRIEFIQGFVDRRIWPISDSSQQLVTFCNSIHLTNAPEALREANRILEAGGTLLVNSAYVKDIALPEGTQRIWGVLAVLARQRLREEKGINEFEAPVDLMKYTAVEYRQMAQEAGFDNVAIETYTAFMDRAALRAICDYRDFAEGALPNIDVELATSALVSSVDELFDRFKIEKIPRNWILLTATKL